MDHPSSHTPAPDAARCRHCGVLFSAVPLLREGGAYCCEGCRLKALLEQGQAPSEGDRVVEALAAALDARERETGLHSKRVACHTLLLARRFDRDDEWLRQIYWGALLHDIGKIGIPDNILLKPGPLTGPEREIIHTHPEIGRRILSGIGDAMAPAADIVFTHHERFDGGGYPRGLKGEAIPFAARLLAIIDALDAITSDRSNRKALSFDVAKVEIVSKSDSQFDPVAVEAFVAEEATLREMVDLKCCGLTPDAARFPGASGTVGSDY